MSHLRDQVSVLPNKKNKAVKGVVHSENKSKRLFRAALKCAKMGNVLENEDSLFNSKIIILLPFDYSSEHNSCTKPNIQEFHP